VVVSACWYLLTGGVGALLVPWWLTGWRADHSHAWWGAVAALGVLLIVIGVLTTVDVFVRFVRAGGTPVPGAMTERLVVTGPNGRVRNPIYVGALAIFLGETLLLQRWRMLVFSVAAWIGTAAFVHWYEEPALRRRFGTDYETYRHEVPAWRPRLRTWTSDPPTGNSRCPATPRGNGMADPDRRSMLFASYENAAVIASAIGHEQLAHPTPCPRYDVAALIDHLVEAGNRAAALGRGEPPPPGDESPHVELSDAPAQLRRAAQEAAVAWVSDFALSSTFTMPWGEEYTGATLVDMYLAELATHAWDLAKATGQLDKLDRSLALPALDGARAAIKPQYRDMIEPGSPFAPEVPLSPSAHDWERLAAFMGRNPRASLG